MQLRFRFDRHWRRCAIVGVIAAALVALSVVGVAAQTTAAIRGVVQDESGGVLPGATVTARHVDTGQERTAVTDAEGRFELPGLRVGSYEISATLQGFKTEVRKNVTLVVGQTGDLRFKLGVGTVSETVQVTGAAPLVDTTGAQLGGVIEEKRIADLPLNGRNYVDLLYFQPGVQKRSSTNAASNGVGHGESWTSMNGTSFRSVAYTLDGTPINDAWAFGPGAMTNTSLGVDGIREFRVMTGTFNAEYGRAMGGVVSIITKSGGNDFRGSAFEFHRDDRLDAKDYFDKIKPTLKRNQFGFSLGGPIQKNKAFFFLNFEGLRENKGITYPRFVPSLAARQDGGLVAHIDPAVLPWLALYPLPNGPDLGGGIATYTFVDSRVNQENYYQGRIDRQLSEKNSIFGRLTIDDGTRHEPLNFEGSGTDFGSKNRFLTVSDQHVFSSALLNSVIGSWARTNISQESTVELPADMSFYPPRNPGSLTIAGLTDVGPQLSTPLPNLQDVFTIGDDLTWVHSAHTLKTGFLWDYYKNYTNNGTWWRGRYLFSSVSSFLLGRPTVLSIISPGSVLARNYRYSVFGAYVQDEWRTRDDLTLNLGVRYEPSTVPREFDGIASVLNDPLHDRQYTVTGGPIFTNNAALKNVAPRVSAAWTPTADRRTAVRGGFGVYYDVGNFGSIFNATGLMPPFAGRVNINGAAFPRADLAGAEAANNVRGIISQHDQATLFAWNVNVQRQLSDTMAVTVAWVQNRGYHLPATIESNPKVPQILADGTQFFSPTAPRRNPALGSCECKGTYSDSWYKALQLQFVRRLARGFQFQASYTWSRAEDTSQSGWGAEVPANTLAPQDPLNPMADKGPSDWDTPHTLNINALYELPFGKGKWWGNWQVNAIWQAFSGQPINPVIATNWSRSGNLAGVFQVDRPNVAPGTDPLAVITGNPRQYFDPSVFSLPPPGTYGNTPRNFLRGPMTQTVDVSIFKDVLLPGLGKDARVQFRLEVFNLLNRANFALPNHTIFGGRSQDEPPLPTAGQITMTATPARQAQIGVRLSF